jgi:hypothetical protein
MATKPPHHKRDWVQDLARHFEKLSVGEVYRFFFYEKRLEQLNEQIPVIFREDSSGLAWRKVLRAFWLRIIQYPERLKIQRLKLKVGALYKDPAEIKWPFEGGEMLPTEDPYINNYAYILDWFASEYGWTKEEIDRLPFASINEFTLAAEFRKVRWRTDIANATNLSDASSEIIAKYPRRNVPITPEMRAYINQVRFEERQRNRGNG